MFSKRGDFMARVYTDYKSIKTRKALEDLSLKELKRMSHDLFAVANKRIRRLQNKDVISPALNALNDRRSGHVTFTIGSKNLKQLQREYSEAMAFLNLETSTVTGAKRYEAKLKQYVGSDISDKNISYMFDLLHSIQERIPERVFGKVAGSMPILEQLQEMLEDDTNSDVNTYESESEKREHIISEAIDKLVNEIDESVQRGQNALQSAADSFNRLF